MLKPCGLQWYGMTTFCLCRHAELDSASLLVPYRHPELDSGSHLIAVLESGEIPNQVWNDKLIQKSLSYRTIK